VRNKSKLAAAGALVLAGALSACGGGSSSAGGSAGPPTDASKVTFCKTFTKLGADATPKAAAVRLTKVGTPSGISSGERHGFEVLLDHLQTMPDNSTNNMLTEMAAGLKPSDRADVVSFLKFYTDECGALPSDSAS
jgi:hypothetical protein